MPLSDSEKLAITQEALDSHYPAVVGELREKISGIAVDSFMGDYSPDPVEHEEFPGSGVGSGVTLHDFALFVAENVTGAPPMDLTPDDAGEIARKCLTF